MRAKHVACYLLLVATVIVSGCVNERELVGRWSMGKSNFYFRKDGVVFYLASTGIKYQGQYSYDNSSDPGIVRADMQAINGDHRPLSLELQVTFLGPDSLRFDSMNGGRNRATLATRMAENLSE